MAGFHQAYTYARDYNEPCAYLVIYKMCRENVTFLLPPAGAMFPSLTVNNKTVFFVVIDLCGHGASASKRGPLRGVEIIAADRVQSLDSAAEPAVNTGGPAVPNSPAAASPAAPATDDRDGEYRLVPARERFMPPDLLS